MFPLDYRKNLFVRSVRLWLFILVAALTFLFLHLKTPNYTTNTFQLQNSFDFERDLENGAYLQMDDPRVINKLLTDFLKPPPEPGPNHIYHLSYPGRKDPSKGQSEVIRSILLNKTNGFFIECGALDGETRSNTLYLERFLNWSGLLIEADPLNFALMVHKNRRAWLSSSCLSKTPYPQKVSFKQKFSVGRISSEKIGEDRPGHVDVQCFPLFSYLVALNIFHIDYFSLDVEGDELDILATLPFEKVNIETLSVEFRHVGGGKEALREFMESKNYSVIAEVTDIGGYANDFIFLKNKIQLDSNDEGLEVGH